MSGRPWTTAEERFVRDNAGALPAEEMADALGRSYRAVVVHAARMRAGGRLGAYLAVRREEAYVSDLVECVECHRPRSSVDADGVCRVCRAEQRREERRAEMERAFWNLPRPLRENTRCGFDVTRDRLRSRKDHGRPPAPDVSGMDRFHAAKALDDYALALEAHELDLVTLDIDALKQRASKWRRKAAKYREGRA